VLVTYFLHIIQPEWHCIALLCWCAVKKLLAHLSRIEMDACGRALTPFFSVCRHFVGYILFSAHILQISSDNVHPFFPWSSRLPFVPPQFPLYSLTRYSGVLHFYPRDAMLALVIAIATCLSVCPSVTRLYCVKMKKASGMISSPSGSPKTLVFRRQISSPNSKGFPWKGLQRRVGRKNSAIFYL